MPANTSTLEVITDNHELLSKPTISKTSNVNGCVKFSSPASSSHERAHANPNHRRTQSETSAASNDASILSSHTSSTLDCAAVPTPPDGGWGWVVVFASFMTNLIADGVTYSFGVLYVEFLNYFKESKGKTAWIGSLFMAIPLLAGPIASALTDRYGCRRVTIVGALLAALGFLLSSFSNSVELLYFTFGIMSGFGLALCYVAAVVIVAYYFDKRRSFATGLSVCGSGIGTFIVAPLTQFLLDKYTWRGTLIILSGLFLNIVACGALMRDLDWTKKKYRSEKSLKTSSESLSQKSTTPPEENKKLMLQEGAALGDLHDSERLCNSLVQLPTFMTDSESIPPDVLEMLRSNRINYEFLVEHYPHLVTRSLSEQVNINSPEELVACRTEPSLSPVDNQATTLDPGPAACSATKRRIPSNRLSPTQREANTAWIKNCTMQNRRLSMAYFQNLRFHRHSITHRGAMLSLHRYHLRASSCPDIYRNSMITIAQEEEDAMCTFMQDLKEVLKDMVNISYFRNVKFLVFCISNLLLYIWYDVPYIYIADNAIQMGIHEDRASLLISIIGILNTIGEILLGYFGDKPWISTTLLYAAFTSICGAVTALVPLVSDYTSLAVVAGTFGFAISANYSLTSIIIVDLITLERFTNAYGLLLLVQGVANLVGPPLAGWLYDITGSYSWSFYMAGLWIFISGAMMIILPCTKRWRRWARRNNKDGPNKSTETSKASRVRWQPSEENDEAKETPV